MLEALLFSLVFALLSVFGVVLLKISWLKKNIKYLLALSAGALIADAVLHLIPHATEHGGLTTSLGITFLLAITLSFVVESVLKWKDCCKNPKAESKEGKKTLGLMNLFGDSWCNFNDGVTLAIAFIASPAAGFATGFAILLHEIPQEIADFGTLIHSGFKKKKAVLANLAISLISVLGVIFGWLVVDKFPELEEYILMFAAGSITYLSLSTLIPEVHTFHRKGFNYGTFGMFLLGMVLIGAIAFIE